MDNWNPIMAETYIKPLRWWEILIAALIWIAGVIAGTWALVAVFLSLGTP